MTTAQRFRIMDPTVAPEAPVSGLAPRLDSLEGKTIGLFNNAKLNSARMLDLVGEYLTEHYQIGGIVRGRYNVSRVMRREEWIDVEKCDAIVLANGD